MIESHKQCSILGCNKPVVARNFCNTHYQRWHKHGHVMETRPSDWGSREKHELYGIWHDILRRRNVACEEWKNDFWKFVSDVGPRPDKSHQFKRIDESKLYTPGNVYWKIAIINDISFRDDRAAYMRAWQKKKREENPLHAFKYGLKKYGISVEEYFSMYDAQNGKCEICGEEEKSIEPKSGNIRKMSVDHCHETGKVRALLCSHCNSGLGRFKDNIEVMQKAIEYIKKHKSP